MLKIDDKKEVFYLALLTRANSEVLLQEKARENASKTGNSYEYELLSLIENRNDIAETLLNEMQKFV
jgi:hypothetical protein